MDWGVWKSGSIERNAARLDIAVMDGLDPATHAAAGTGPRVREPSPR
jgi:hypothetical protein